MRRFASIMRWVAAGSIIGIVVIVAAYLIDIDRAYDRIRGKAAVVPTPYGDVTYAEGGEGEPVLVIHGSGGGWDQGRLVAEAALEDGFRWIAPSRFGYLGSTFYEGATFDEQAHAYASLLDSLGIDRVAVVALSHGGPSALLFAALHPERVSSLTLISAGVAASGADEQAGANAKGSALTTIFQHDPLYWGVATFGRRMLTGLMGADAAVVKTLTPGEADLVERLIDEMNPVAPRAAGVLFDNTAAMPNERISAIQAPTLVLHAKDDGLQLHHNAEYAAATIPGAKLVSFERGGHLVLAVERETIRGLVADHIRGAVDAGDRG